MVKFFMDTSNKLIWGDTAFTAYTVKQLTKLYDTWIGNQRRIIIAEPSIPSGILAPKLVLNINIPPSPNYKINLMYFPKSGHNSLLIRKKR
jgi:hypothetical protein